MKKSVTMISLIMIILSSIFMLKTIYTETRNIIFPYSLTFMEFTGNIIATIVSILICLIAISAFLKLIITNKEKQNEFNIRRNK